MAFNKPPTRANKVVGQDSPKNTVKIAQLEKSKEPREPEIRSFFGQAGDSKSESKSMVSEFNSFKEEMRTMITNMNDSITTNVSGKISNKIEALENKFSIMFNEFRADIQTLKSDMTKVKADMDKMSDQVKDIEKSLEFQSSKVRENDEKQEKTLSTLKAEIDTKMQELNQKLLLMEKHERKYNLLFYGFPEEQRGENIYDKMRNVFIEDLQLDPNKVDNMYCAHAHRLPAENQEGPRPLIIRFASYADRELVLANSYKLAGSRRRILPDLPVIMKKERSRLAREAYTIRKNENMQTRIRDRGLEVYLEVRKESTDRWAKRTV